MLCRWVRAKELGGQIDQGVLGSCRSIDSGRESRADVVQMVEDDLRVSLVVNVELVP
jgi:hypothetical protein